MSQAKSTIKARPVRFDWSNTPLHWVPNDPFATHLINGLHLIAPTAERWFLKVYQQAMPHIQDEALKADVRGFMGQEAMHARAHDAVIDQLKSYGIDPQPFLDRYESVCHFLYAEDVPWVPEALKLHWRLAVVAAGEQMTCVLGDWILEAERLEAAGADPVMLDLLRWHGAEEVEHRSVAFDALKHITGLGEYPLRVSSMVVVFPLILMLWTDGVNELLRQDTSLAGRRFGFEDFLRIVQQGRCPGFEIPAAALRYLLPWFHPAQEGSLERAAEVLAVNRGVAGATA